VVHLEEPGTFLGAHEGVPEAQFITYTAVARRVILLYTLGPSSRSDKEQCRQRQAAAWQNTVNLN
jgi:hypothetical protein